MNYHHLSPKVLFLLNQTINTNLIYHCSHVKKYDYRYL